MNKALLIIILTLFLTKIYAQENNDVRNTYWGMTADDVIKSEHPLNPTTQTIEKLTYENVFIGSSYSINEFYAAITYYFKNMKLIKVEYVVKQKDKPENTIIPLTKKVDMTEFIFNALSNKDYQCKYGWSISKIVKDYRQDTCSRTNEVIKKVEEMAKENNDIHISVSFKNDRSFARFLYYEFQNSTATKNWAYGNLFCKIEFEANFQMQREILKSGF